MKLTRKKAIQVCIELWTFLAKTGLSKDDWPKWDALDKKYGWIPYHCPFCGYAQGKTMKNGNVEWRCRYCPYHQEYGMCTEKGSPYDKWDNARANHRKPATLKRHARAFLAQLEVL